MRKRLLMIGAVGIVVALTLNHDDARAASSEAIQSRGSFVFGGDSRVALYSADIAYLKGELDSLFGELPGNNNNEFFVEE